MTYILGHVIILESSVTPECSVSSDHVRRSARGTPCPSKSCVVYIKRDVVGVRALGKSKCHSDTREPRPHNRISVTEYSYV